MKTRYLILISLFSLVCFSGIVTAYDQAIYVDYSFTCKDSMDVWADLVNDDEGNDFLYPRDIIEEAILVAPATERDLYLNRLFCVTNTSCIPDNAIITEVLFFMKLIPSAEIRYLIMLGNNDGYESPNNAFYNNFENIILTDNTISYTDYFEHGLRNSDDSTNYSWFNKTGITTLCFREYASDYLVTEPRDKVYIHAVTEQELWFEYDPYFLVTYTLPSCDSTNITMYENIVNATGYHNYTYNSTTGFNVWANYTGNESSASCEGIVWVNYSDSNVTFNVSVDKSDDSNTSSYMINEDNWLYLSALSLSPELMLITLLGLFFYFAEKRKSFVLYMIVTLIALPSGIYFLGWEEAMTSKLIGVAIFMFSIYCAGLSLAYGLKGQESKD
jgi:hypothetical protein